ncbi:MAG: ABC transporter permease [Planctomycetota bacterium]
MTAYIIRRLLYMIPIVFGVLLVTFCLFTLVGGDISVQIAGKNADAETIAEIRHEYGFDKPLFVGYEPLVDDQWKEPTDPNVLASYIESPDGDDTIILNDYQRIVAIENAKRQWLGGLFKQRLSDGRILDAWSMLDFNSQFLSHFKKAVTFNFGRDRERQKISEKLLQGVGPSLALTVPMFIGSLIISISLSLIVAFIRGSVGDFVIVVVCVILMSIPYLSYIIFGQLFFAYELDWFPIYYDPSRPMAVSVVLPILIGIIAGLGVGVRFYRTIMLDEIRSDYVRTAFAKGLTTPKVLFKHVLKNAMIPIVTNVVLSLPRLVLGSLLLERFFGIPGLGYLMIEAINSRDFFVLNAMTFMMALLIVIFTLVADICYGWVDPRVKFE